MLLDLDDPVAGVVERLTAAGGREDELGPLVGAVGSALQIASACRSLTSSEAVARLSWARAARSVSRMPSTPRLPKMCRYGSRRSG
jgi:hypothetical protein